MRGKMELANDPRWQRFNDSSRPCPCCGRTFDGVFDIGYDHPDPWPHGNRAESGQDVLSVGVDELGTDLCSFGKYRFIRCVLPIPIIGTDQRFAFGPWGSVNPDNFALYVNSHSLAIFLPKDCLYSPLALMMTPPRLSKG